MFVADSRGLVLPVQIVPAAFTAHEAAALRQALGAALVAERRPEADHALVAVHCRLQDLQVQPSRLPVPAPHVVGVELAAVLLDHGLAQVVHLVAAEGREARAHQGFGRRGRGLSGDDGAAAVREKTSGAARAFHVNFPGGRSRHGCRGCPGP